MLLQMGVFRNDEMSGKLHCYFGLKLRWIEDHEDLIWQDEFDRIRDYIFFSFFECQQRRSFQDKFKIMQ
jgi:hypothetical protein